MDNQNPLTQPVNNDSVASDLPISEIVSALKNTLTPAPIVPLSTTPAALATPPVTPAPPTIPPPPSSPLYENPDLVKVPGQ